MVGTCVDGDGNGEEAVGRGERGACIGGGIVLFPTVGGGSTGDDMTVGGDAVLESTRDLDDEVAGRLITTLTTMAITTKIITISAIVTFLLELKRDILEEGRSSLLEPTLLVSSSSSSSSKLLSCAPKTWPTTTFSWRFCNSSSFSCCH